MIDECLIYLDKDQFKSYLPIHPQEIDEDDDALIPELPSTLMLDSSSVSYSPQNILTR